MTDQVADGSDQAKQNQIDVMDDRAQLDRLVNQMLVAPPNRIAVVHIGHITEDAPAPPRGAEFYPLSNPTAPGGRRDFNIGFPDADTPGRRPVLVVYAWAGILALWDRMGEDVDGFLQGRQQVILIFLQEKFARLSFENHAYFLSVILSALPRRKFVTRLAVYVSAEARGEAAAAAVAAQGHPAAIVPWPMRLLGGASCNASGGDARNIFSALVVSVTPRRSALGSRMSLGWKAAAALGTASSLVRAYCRFWLIRAAKAGCRLGSRADRRLVDPKA